MATKNMSYDNAAYQAVMGGGKATGNMSGSGGTSTKFSAFTGMIVKSVVLAATTAGTSADGVVVIKVATSQGTNTSTSTSTYGTMGSGAFSGYFAPSGSGTNTQMVLAQGDTWWVQKGTDATGTYVGDVELVLQPLANVTQ